MKPTHYFVSSSYGTKPKNNLEQKFQEYLDTLDGTLIEADDLDILITEIRRQSLRLNTEHTRCKPLEISFWKTQENAFSIGGFYRQIFSIKPAILKKLLK